MKLTKINYWLYGSILLAIGLTPLLWLNNNYIINGSDINFPLNPIKEFKDRLFAWNPNYNCGIDNCINFGSLPFCLLKVGLFYITHSIQWTQKLTFIFWLLFMGISILIFTYEIFQKHWHIARISAILFYLINLYQLALWRIVNMAPITALSTIPIMLAIVIKIFRYKKRKYIAAYGIISLIWGITSINPPIIILTFILLFIFTIYISFKYKNSLRWNLKSIALIFIVTISINSYCILPLAHKFITTKETKEEIINRYNAFRYLRTQSKCSSFTNVIRLMGNSEFHFDWKGDPYYPSFRHFLRKRHQLLGFMLPFLVLIGSIYYRKMMYVKFFFFIALFGIIFSMGIHYPLTKIYNWLFDHLPLFWLFRSPWLKFSILTILAYSILGGLGCQALYSIFNRYRISIFLILFIWLLHLYFMSPLLQGKMFTEKKDHIYLKPTKINIPTYIYDFCNWVNKQEGDFNILLLPDEKQSIYEWGYMGLNDITEMLLNKGVIHREYGESGKNTEFDRVYEEIIKKIYNKDPSGLENLLQSARIKYICQRNDFEYNFYKDTDSPEFIKQTLSNHKFIKYIKSFGKWDVYALEKEPALLIDITGNIKPNIKLTKINPTYYKVTLKNTEKAYNPIVLIFRQNFHPHWRATLKSKYGKFGMLLQEHYKLKYYANAWDLKKLIYKDCEIIVSYTPQKLFHAGLLTTAFTLIYLLCYGILFKKPF